MGEAAAEEARAELPAGRVGAIRRELVRLAQEAERAREEAVATILRGAAFRMGEG